MLVDDDANVLKVQSAIWKQNAQIEVATYTDPSVAVSEILKRPSEWDIVVTDVHMPKMDGRVLRAAVRGMVTVVLTSIDPIDYGEWAKDDDWEVMFVMKPFRKESVESVRYHWESNCRGRTKRLARTQEIAELRRQVASLRRTNEALQELVDETVMTSPKPTMPSVDSEFADTPTEIWKRKCWVGQLHWRVLKSQLDTALGEIRSLSRRFEQYESSPQQHSERDLVCVERVARQGRVWVGFDELSRPHVLVKETGERLNAVRFSGRVTMTFETTDDRSQWLGSQESEHELVGASEFQRCAICGLELPQEKLKSHVMDCSG